MYTERTGRINIKLLTGWKLEIVIKGDFSFICNVSDFYKTEDCMPVFVIKILF